MNSEQAAVLRAPFPPGAIGQLPRAGIKLDYVGHAAVTDRLLKADPAWTWEPLAFGDDGRPLIIVRGSEASMWIRLTVCDVTRIGVGTVKSDAFEVEKQLIGDAIRNAAMRFGVALDLWSKEERPGVDITREARQDSSRPDGVRTATEMSSHIVTPVNVEREIIRLCELCELVVTRIADRARKAAETDSEYKRVHARAVLEATGTIPERDAKATLASADEYLKKRIAEAEQLAAQDAGRNYRAQLDALRSINANVRQMSGLQG